METSVKRLFIGGIILSVKVGGGNAGVRKADFSGVREGGGRGFRVRGQNEFFAMRRSGLGAAGLKQSSRIFDILAFSRRNWFSTTV